MKNVIFSKYIRTFNDFQIDTDYRGLGWERKIILYKVKGNISPKLCRTLGIDLGEIKQPYSDARM